MKKVKFTAKDQAQFFATLRQRVQGHFKENDLSINGDWRMILKTIAMFLLYLIPFGLILSNTLPLWAAFVLSIFMGLGLAGIGFSVMHDANHGSYTKYKGVNKFIADLAMVMIGGSSFTWKVQHNLLHHTYTNVYEMDEDIHDKPGLRLSPHGKWKNMHRYQHFYASFLYMLMTLSWFTQKDFKQLRQYNKNGLTQKIGYKPLKATLDVIFGKVIYIGVFLVMPFFILQMAWWQWLLVFLLQHAVAGFVLAIVFQLAHLVEGTSHHKPTEMGTIENTWAIHQLETTANFARNDKFISWFVGGLNFQVEHHLFPNICHIHYKEVSEIVKKTALEFGIPYHDQPTFRKAVVSHYKVLKDLGRNHALETSIVF